MIPSVKGLLTGRVARQVFVMFAVSALVPLAAMAVLSLDQVRAILLEQGERRLAATAKTYAMAVFERMLLARDFALAAAARPESAAALDAVARRMFTSWAAFDSRGRAVGPAKPALPALSAEQRERLGQGKPVVIVTAAGAAVRVSLLVASPAEKGGVVVGDLSPEYLWGGAEQFPVATDFCVHEEGSRTILYCPVAGTAGAIGAVEAASSRSAIASVRWLLGGEPQRAIAWGQFLRAGFGTPDWVFVASQPESFQLLPAREFRQVYVPVVALALLLIAWFTIRQSRSILEPVRKLAERARAVARNEFGARLDMKRADEFGELAGAFDHMSAKLGSQFATITALAEIDRLILATFDTDQVVRTTLRRLREIVPAEALAIALFDRQSAGQALTYLGTGPAGEPEILVTKRPEEEARRLLEGRGTAGRWLAQDDEWPGFLGSLRERGARVAYLHPIVWRDSLCGALAIGWREAPTAGREDEQVAREFADRIAVAVSSAWRDEQLYVQAHFDALTGLPNRLLFRDRLEREMVRCQRESGRLSVLFIDLDNFKRVNDSWGHTAGDEVLQEAARRITGCVRGSDTVSRLGGDEFTVLLTRIQQPQQASRVAGQIEAALAAELRAAGHPAYLSASIGIASYPGDGESAEELLRNADTAMYRAKASGRAAVVYFEERMNAEALARLTLDRDLRAALERGEFALQFQPVVEIATGRVRSAEALLRWNHPTRGMIPPASFIPIAEESGLIEPIGRLVIAQTCRQAGLWHQAGLALDHVSFNVSPRQFRRGDLASFLDECIEQNGIPASMLEIEITEGLLVEQADVARNVLGSLAAKGVRIALDDFGTGFSSMAYLTRFPVDTIKIDRMFVADLGSTADAEAIVSAIIAMSQALGKRVVAEGAETEKQLGFLRRLGCGFVQGHVLSPALSPHEFEQFLEERDR